jgi:hypothetical protein
VLRVRVLGLWVRSEVGGRIKIEREDSRSRQMQHFRWERDGEGGKEGAVRWGGGMTRQV